MARYRQPTIKERGGLEAHLTSMAVDYSLFKLLRGLPGQNNSTIANSLSKGRKKPLRPETIKHWIQVDDEEAKEKS